MKIKNLVVPFIMGLIGIFSFAPFSIKFLIFISYAYLIHKILYENSSELRNDYGMILVNHQKCNNLDYEASLSLYKWLASEDAAKIIKNYSISNSKVFYID